MSDNTLPSTESVVRARLDGGERSFVGESLAGEDLRGLDLSGVDLREADLCDADLRGADLRGADLRDVRFSRALLLGADLRGAHLDGADFHRARFDSKTRWPEDFEFFQLGALGPGAHLLEMDLRGENLRGFDLSRASLRGCDLTGAILEGANLQYANIEGACLEGTTANSTQFYGCRYDAETRWPVGTSHKTLQAFGPQTRLPFAHLAGIRLLDADLREADLRAANMERVQLDRSRLDEARLDGALLFNASLREVSLVGGSLPRANLRRADLTQADLRDTNLRAADLREANLDGTLFEGASTSYRTKWPPDFQQSRTNPPRRGMSSRLVFIPLVWPLMLYLLIGRMLFLGIHQINTITAFLARKARWSPLTGLEIDAYNFHNDKRFALTWPISAPLGVVAALALLAAGLVAALVGSTWTFLRRSWRTSEDVLDALWHWTKS